MTTSWRWATPLAVTVSATLIFALTLASAVQVADSAELVTVACKLGVAHPPGYPLYTLLGHAFCALPFGATEAWRLALMSLLCGVWAALMLFACARQLGCPRWASAVGALLLCSGGGFWRLASYAETRTLLVALSLSLIYAALRAAAPRAVMPGAGREGSALGWCGVAGLAGGLALSTHHTAAALGPFAAAAVLYPWRGTRVQLARVGAALAGLCAGLLPYLQLLLADPARLPRWGDPSTLGGLLHHVLRRDYGTLSLSVAEESRGLANLARYVVELPRELAWILLPLALLGLLALFARRLAPTGEDDGGRWPARPHAVALGLGFVLAGPLLLSQFNVDPRGIGGQVVARFYALPNAVLCLCVAVGLATADRRLLARATLSRQRLWRLVPAGAALALGAVGSYPRADLSESFAVEDYAHNVLMTVAPGALVLGVGDVELFATSHAQQLRGLGRGVQYVDLRMLLHRWYVQQQRRAYPGFSYRFVRGNVDTIGLVRAELARGRAVYLTKVYNRTVARAFRLVPEGPLLRVAVPGERPQQTRALVQRNLALFARFARRGRPPDAATDPWSASLYEAHARTWRALARAARQMGDPQLAGRLDARARRWTALGGVAAR